MGVVFSCAHGPGARPTPLSGRKGYKCSIDRSTVLYDMILSEVAIDSFYYYGTSTAL